MNIKQFEDKNIAHYSYAIVNDGQMALIDPERNPSKYYEYAKECNAKITAVIETHPHADFVSSHLEIHQTTGAVIYTSKLVSAEYPHTTFDDGDEILLGNGKLKAMNTPGHSPDSISVLAIDEDGKELAVFTGDTLFIGDCGRPDLREEAGAITSSREELAKAMYKTLNEKFMTLPDKVLVYPAHGAGSLCGKSLSDANFSTIGNEKLHNWSMKPINENQFVKTLLENQPFIPKYFPFAVGINKKGADNFQKSVSEVEKVTSNVTEDFIHSLDPNILVIDTRPQNKFKQSHLRNAINLMNDLRFETWLGAVVNPNEPFYLVSEDETQLNELIERIAKIGYEKQIKLAFISDKGHEKMDIFDSTDLNQDHYTIVDIRNESEVITNQIFKNSIHIPLYELRERIEEIPIEKPILVHCAGGYRSAAGSSIIKSKLENKAKVYDLSEAVKQFQ